MRVRTDARRQAIVTAAWDVFRENGFERTTMSEISERVGGSKATLYGYFQSKEQLFAAALEQVIGDSAEKTFSELAAPAEFEDRLLKFAESYLAVRLSQNSIAIERALIAEGNARIWANGCVSSSSNLTGDGSWPRSISKCRQVACARPTR